RGALGADQRPGAAVKDGEDGAGCHVLALGHAPFDPHLRVQGAVGGVEPGTPADARVLLASQEGAFRLVREQGGGGVAIAQILEQGAADVVQDHRLRRRKQAPRRAHAGGKSATWAVARASSASSTGMPSSTL